MLFLIHQQLGVHSEGVDHNTQMLADTWVVLEQVWLNGVLSPKNFPKGSIPNFFISLVALSSQTVVTLADSNWQDRTDLSCKHGISD